MLEPLLQQAQFHLRLDQIAEVIEVLALLLISVASGLEDILAVRSQERHTYLVHYTSHPAGAI